MRWSEEAAAYLYGEDGRRMVAQRLARYGLPAGLEDDLAQDAFVRVLRSEERGVEPRNVEAFVTTLVQRAARDLLWGTPQSARGPPRGRARTRTGLGVRRRRAGPR